MSQETARMQRRVKVGEDLPERQYTPDNIQLFLYNAVLFNAHRIHFDQPYATDVEGYPGLVVAGPLLGDWLNQCVEEWLGEEGRLLSIDYSNRQACFIGETLTSGGRVINYDADTNEVQLALFIRNEAGDVIAPATATAVFTQ